MARIAALGLLAGCVPALLPPSARDPELDRFLARPERHAVFAPVDIQVDDQLKVMGRGHRVERLAQAIDPAWPLTGVVERMIELAPPLGDGATKVAVGAEVGALPLDPGEPVLFLHSSWKLVYRRLPPDLGAYRLQVGIIARIIPLRQVLEDKGAQNLGTAAWHGSCVLDAFDGAFLDIAELERDNAARLREAIADVQQKCGDRLGVELRDALGTFGRAPPVVRP